MNKFPGGSFYLNFPAHMCHMFSPRHPPLFDHPNGIWQGVITTKLHITQFSPPPLYFLPYIQIFLSASSSRTPSGCVAVVICPKIQNHIEDTFQRLAANPRPCVTFRNVFILPVWCI